ncbi:Uncharacterized protein OBRU01_21716 [Operophtera brumata]|uniref:Uncharacterized protein n=1 Tax=Operophtera brumata TaxID=104452 RepID=A0A0L7KNP9_OPEBR|nr:Uncharacterized protein OBRU01_21716 [Operophtera brumata]
MAPKLMSNLCSQLVPQEDQEFYRRVTGILDDYYPEDWRSWEVEDLSYTDLFGTTISPKTEAKLRFAIPTVELAKAFTPGDPYLSEKKYRAIKRKLLEWPLGRAVLYAPHKVAERLHEKSYDQFMTTVRTLKPTLTSRDMASGSSHRKRRSTSQESTASAKTPRTDNLSEDMQCTLFEKMMQVITSQTKAIESVSEKVNSLTLEREESQPDSYESAEESTQDEEEFDAPSFRAMSVSTGPKNSPQDCSEAEALATQIAEAQRKLAEITSGKKSEQSDCDFSPNTAEAEPKLAKADPQIAEQGRKCQRLGDEGWKNVRYADVQKTFHATPVFGALKVNSVLATNTPSWTSLGQLEKTDLTLGAITHGLLLQRKAFQETCKSLDPKLRKEIQGKFLAADCSFRKISDGLLQYTCGRRAEVIQNRRETYKPANKVLNDILHEIPPSDTHLFSEEKITEAMKDQGGAHKFFPRKNNYKPNGKKTFPTKNTKAPAARETSKFKKPFQGSKNFRSSNKQQQNDFTNKNKTPQGGGKKS